MPLAKVNGTPGWVHIYKNKSEVWVNGKKAENGKFSAGGVDFEVGDQPERGDIHLRVVYKPQPRARSWEE